MDKKNQSSLGQEKAMKQLRGAVLILSFCVLIQACTLVVVCQRLRDVNATLAWLMALVR